MFSVNPNSLCDKFNPVLCQALWHMNYGIWTTKLINFKWKYQFFFLFLRLLMECGFT